MELLVRILCHCISRFFFQQQRSHRLSVQTNQGWNPGPVSYFTCPCSGCLCPLSLHFLIRKMGGAFPTSVELLSKQQLSLSLSVEVALTLGCEISCQNKWRQKGGKYAQNSKTNKQNYLLCWHNCFSVQFVNTRDLHKEGRNHLFITAILCYTRCLQEIYGTQNNSRNTINILL